MLVGAGRFCAALPPKGQSMFNLNCPGWRESRRRRPGVPGQQPQPLRLCVPLGVCQQRVPRRATPEDPPSSRRRSAGSPAAGRHQAPPPEREAGSSPPRAQRVVLPGTAASVRQRDRGSQLVPGRPSPPEADTGAAAVPKRSRLFLPLAASASKWETARSGVFGPRSPTGLRALASSGQPESLGSLHRGRDRAPAASPALVVPHFFRCRTARSGASRLRVSVGPSGAEQLSVRHAPLRGHAPLN
ncbi:hypothetical protein NDU88_001490 [Pleurodeles waltl]|uniref:Uncharacterized protein n=1 Tax=Pleurodeles waltl TaxID=8319 RepID=A0AAV7P6X1_PLEWA|nr:hypothetical protein NDU88_001490 [Pleurodeles waltl]